MVIDTFQKRFVMNMQLKQCFSRTKPFRLEKRQILSSFSWFPKKTKGVQKKPEFQTLVSKKPNWQPCICWLLSAQKPVSECCVIERFIWTIVQRYGIWRTYLMSAGSCAP